MRSQVEILIVPLCDEDVPHILSLCYEGAPHILSIYIYIYIYRSTCGSGVGHCWLLGTGLALGTAGCSSVSSLSTEALLFNPLEELGACWASSCAAS